MKLIEFQKSLVSLLPEDSNLIFSILRHRSFKGHPICRNLIMKNYVLLAKLELVFTWKKRKRQNRIIIKDLIIMKGDININHF